MRLGASVNRSAGQRAGRAAGLRAAFLGLADAIVDDLALLDDDDFVRRSLGLRWMSDFGGPDDDPIAWIRKLAAAVDPSEHQLEAWARKWRGPREPQED